MRTATPAPILSDSQPRELAETSEKRGFANAGSRLDRRPFKERRRARAKQLFDGAKKIWTVSAGGTARQVANAANDVRTPGDF